MTHLIIPFLQVNVADKIKDAPDNGYQIGVIIGSFLPFLLLAGVAVWMFYRAQKADRNE